MHIDRRSSGHRSPRLIEMPNAGAHPSPLPVVTHVSEDTWTAVDAYLAELVAPEDRALRSAVEESLAAGLPEIQVSPLQGKLLMLLARIRGARNILEIGTLGGYSTIWLARALPRDGTLISLEIDPKHAELARSNIARARLSASVEVRVGPALETLPELQAEGLGPFDLVFIDADKPSNPQYLEWALRLSRPGTLIIADNVVRSGAVLDPSSDDPKVVGTRRLHELLSAEQRLDATVIQTVGVKGYDGFALAVVRDAPRS